MKKRYWLNLELPNELEKHLEALDQFGLNHLTAMPHHITVIRDFTWRGSEEELTALVDRVVLPFLPLKLEIEGVGRFPHKNRCHGYVALANHGGNLQRLYREFVKAGGHRLQFRRYPNYQPHISVARNMEPNRFGQFCRQGAALPESFEVRIASLLANESGNHGCWEIIHLAQPLQVAC